MFHWSFTTSGLTGKEALAPTWSVGPSGSAVAVPTVTSAATPKQPIHFVKFDSSKLRQVPRWGHQLLCLHRACLDGKLDSDFIPIAPQCADLMEIQ